MLQRWARAALLLGALAQWVALSARVVAAGYQALAPLPEQLSVMLVFAVLLYLLVGTRVPLFAVGAVLAPLGVVVAVSAYFFEGGSIPAPREASSVWLTLHIGPTLLAYGVFALSFCLSLAYLLQERQLKAKGRSGLFRRLPPLETLDQWNYRLVGWGFVFFTIGILGGSWLAKQRWGELWSWEPLQTWSGIAWLLYAALLHLRSIGWRGKRAAQLVVLSFLLLLVSFIGISTLFPGRHGMQTSWSRSS